MGFCLLHASSVAIWSALTPTTWAPAASNWGRAPSKLSSSLVQVPVNAWMNVKMTTGPLAVRSASLTCLPPGAARVKSGAFCPTSSAATGEARARPVSSRATTGARIPRRMGGLLSRVRVDADRTLGGLPKFPARAHNARMPTVLAPEAVVAEGISRQAICISWRIHRERVLLAGWGRAILLQLAHPMVAQG